MKRAALVATICVLFGSRLAAQTTGSIEGTVVGEGSVPVVGVSVTARHIATNTPYQVTSDDMGHYRFRVLPPGTYEVTTADAPSLAARAQRVKVAFGATTTLDFNPSVTLATKKGARGSGPRTFRFEASGRLGYTNAEGVARRGVEGSLKAPTMPAPRSTGSARKR